MIDNQKLEQENAELRLALELTEPVFRALRSDNERMRKALIEAHVFFSVGLSIADYDQQDPAEKHEYQRIKLRLDMMFDALKPSAPNTKDVT